MSSGAIRPRPPGHCRETPDQNQTRYVSFEVWYILREPHCARVIEHELNYLQGGEFIHALPHSHDLHDDVSIRPSANGLGGGKSRTGRSKVRPDIPSQTRPVPLPTSFPRESKCRTLNLRLSVSNFAHTAEAVIEFIYTLVVMPAQHSPYADAAVVLCSGCVQRWFDTFLARGFVGFA